MIKTVADTFSINVLQSYTFAAHTGSLISSYFSLNTLTSFLIGRNRPNLALIGYLQKHPVLIGRIYLGALCLDWLIYIYTGTRYKMREPVLLSEINLSRTCRQKLSLEIG